MGRPPSTAVGACVLFVALALPGYCTGRAVAPRDDISSFVVGGDDAPRGRFRYMVNLLDGNGRIRCAGTLIHPFVVLTAAHCGDIGIRKVMIGRYNVNMRFGDDPDEYEERMVAEVAVHPRYSGFPSVANDVMLLRLDAGSSKPTISINWDGSADLRKELTVLGWGTTTTRPKSDILQFVDLDYIDNNRCNNEFAWNGLVKDDMMCAQRGDKDSCAGDSGGPLIIAGATEAEDLQVGIVAGGLVSDCSNPLFPGVYSRISRAWGNFLSQALRKWGFESDVTGGDDSDGGEGDYGDYDDDDDDDDRGYNPGDDDDVTDGDDNNGGCTCKDDPHYRFRGKAGRDCKWVGARVSRRCSRRSSWISCPKTCNKCYCSGETVSERCRDDPIYRYRGDKKKDCDWVAKKRSKRCKVKRNEQGCPESCGVC